MSLREEASGALPVDAEAEPARRTAGLSAVPPVNSPRAPEAPEKIAGSRAHVVSSAGQEPTTAP